MIPLPPPNYFQSVPATAHDPLDSVDEMSFMEDLIFGVSTGLALAFVLLASWVTWRWWRERG